MANLMPPADVQKVRHGKWENVGDNLIMEQTTIVGKYVKCSECGNEILVARTDNGSYRFSNYCSICGAKMDKEGLKMPCKKCDLQYSIYCVDCVYVKTGQKGSVTACQKIKAS